jgi:hypothetical protein
MAAMLFGKVHKALCSTVPVKLVGPQSKDWWDPALNDLLDRRTVAHANLTAYCNSLPCSTSLSSDAANLHSDPTWQHLWATYVKLHRQAHELV